MTPREWEAGDDHTNAWLKRMWQVSSLLVRMSRDCCYKGVRSGERGFGGIDQVIYELEPLNGKTTVTEVGGNLNWQAMPAGNARNGVLPRSYLNF